jgi:hypothetical protein
VTFLVRVGQGDWGGAQVNDVEAVARSVAACFPAACGDDGAIAILLEPTPGADDAPIALTTPGPAGEFVVRVNVRGMLWARLVYQFAHEFCHVLADPRSIAFDRYTWLEEALCEAGSLFALRRLAEGWAEAPPYPNWRDYAAALAAYEAGLAAHEGRSLPDGVPFAGWLAERLPLLEKDAGRRDDNAIVARELLPIFEANEAAWNALRYLHAAQRPPDGTPAAFIARWSAASPQAYRTSIAAIGALLAG